MEFLNRVQSYIDRHQLFSRQGLQLVALSGGADSVALLLVLRELNYKVEAVHCNFHLRGEESDRDEEFVKTLCQETNTELHLVHFDTNSYATTHKVSVEMAARELRYSYFRQLSADIHAETVCVAHHKDDQAETVMLNLLRGTGIDGMKGMLPKNGTIARPLLCVGRSDIENFLKERGQSFVVDSTNHSNDFLRNRLRNVILPMLNDCNRGFSDHVAQLAERVAELQPLIDDATERLLQRACEPSNAALLFPPVGRYNLQTLWESPSAEHLLYKLLKRHDFSSEQVSAIYASRNQLKTGDIFRSSTHEAVIDRGYIVFYKPMPQLSITNIPECGRYRLSPTLRLSVTECDVDSGFRPSKEAFRITIDANQVVFPLTVRTATEGDWFVPFGMKGRRLVSNFLTDLKIDNLAKRRQLVLENADGRLIWMVGLRTDQRFRVASETTKVITIELFSDNPTNKQP